MNTAALLYKVVLSFEGVKLYTPGLIEKIYRYNDAGELNGFLLLPPNHQSLITNL